MTSSPKQPAGTPVSTALKLLPLPQYLPPFHNALAALDTVHGDGTLPNIGMDLNPGIHPQTGVFQVDTPTGRPVGIAVDPRSETPGMTLLHEIGHFLDWSACSPAGQFSSQHSPALQHWRAAVQSTPTVHTLRTRQQTATQRAAAGDSLAGYEARITAYWLQTEELFARSYAQYIAMESADSDLLRELALLRSRTPLMRLTQWDSSEFTVLVTAFDTLFLQRGWRV